MMTNTARTTSLNALTLSYISAHTDYPGHTGTNEVAGGSYARVSATVNTASGTPPTRALNASVDINIPAATTVRWIGVWSAATLGSFWSAMPNGGVPNEFYIDPSTDVITLPAHGYIANQKIVFYGGTPPAGLTEGVIYFAVTITTDTFKVSATSGGSAIDLTDRGTGACLVSTIVEETYSGAGLLTVTSATFAYNN